MRSRGVDRLFLISFLLLLLSGLVIFISAALGLLARDTGKFQNVLLSQLVMGFGGGTAALLLALRIPITFWKRNAFWILAIAIALSLCVFIPGIGMAHGGARRWIDLGFFNFQPAELLKFGLVVYLAAWFAQFRHKVHSPLFGFYPLLGVLAIAGTLLMAQPDTGTFLIAAMAGVVMFWVAGATRHQALFLVLGGVVLLIGVAIWKPYVMDRFMTLFRPDDFQGAGYQIKQSLIAIGSGGVAGRGFGQSVQKFNYLPEPIGDSIFAVMGEELGLIGASVLIFLYLFFLIAGFRVAARTADRFSGLLAVGLVILITSQSFVNIASMLALGPLTGVPLVFVSHGGTALLVAMAEVGVILNISRQRKSA